MRNGKRMKTVVSMAAVLMVSAFAYIVSAQSAPQLINYQGRLTDSSGVPLAEGSTVDIRFSFYGSETEDSPLYLTVLQEDVTIQTGGMYNILIGSGTLTPGTENSLALVFQDHSEVWMGVRVNTDPEMTPRSRITGAPYAMSLDTTFMGAFVGAADYDGDGYMKPAYTSINIDCNDGNSSMYPGATEVCDDGYDNDCDGDIDNEDPECVPPGMAFVPAGCFQMGDHFNEGDSDELPVHQVCISSGFFMDVHEVTNAEYRACVDAGECTPPSDTSSSTRSTYYGEATYENYPVLYVDYDQANDYCAWQEKRLPTEAEWEYAARGGLSGKRYPWGDTVTGSDANYEDSGDQWDNDTSPVENYAPNGYGLYDMSGNVREWTADWYQSDYYSVSPQYDPAGPASGTMRVVRGGCWYNAPYLIRAAERLSYYPTMFEDSRTGFRCVAE